jgi:hypothetical protein
MGAPGDYFLSPKSADECTAVSGVVTPYYTWESGEWRNYSSWSSLFWRAREWKILNTGSESLFSRLKLANELSIAHNKFVAQSRQTYQYCR